MIKIAPAIFSGNLSYLSKEIEKISNADLIHFDVMDGHFTPEITCGKNTIASLRNKTELLFDVHLLIDNPLKHIKEFITSSDIITIHAETTNNLSQALSLIKESGIKAGVALNPSTPISKIISHLEEIDMIVIMTTDPTVSNEKFDTTTLSKIEEIRNIIIKGNLTLDIQADGRINIENGKLAVKAGANILVAGSFVLKNNNPAQAIEELRNL
ncbi:MAG: ribulose-phosphate 3-epimerase [bacterium]|nr:ribulose-phosphate 3-epimerase [bacterium]